MYAIETRIKIIKKRLGTAIPVRRKKNKIHSKDTMRAGIIQELLSAGYSGSEVLVIMESGLYD